MLARKVSKVGNSLGITLPKEAIAHLKIGEGDTLYLVETAKGYEITAYDKAFAEQIEAAERFMQRNRNALRELAK